MASQSLLPESWAVPQVFRDRLGDEVGRQRVMHADGHLLLVLHRVPGEEDLVRRGRFFWRQPDGTWRCHPDGGDQAALHRHVKEYEDAVRKLEEQEESATGAEDYFAVLRWIVPLCRAARHLHAVLQQARELQPGDRDLITSRDEAGNVERAAELVAADASNGLEYAMAKQAEEHAKNSYAMAISSHRLNRLAAIFFPIATIGAVFGMNVTHGYETEYAPFLFWALVAGTVILGVFLNLSIMNTPPRLRSS